MNIPWADIVAVGLLFLLIAISRRTSPYSAKIDLQKEDVPIVIDKLGLKVVESNGKKRVVKKKNGDPVPDLSQHPRRGKAKLTIVKK